MGFHLTFDMGFIKMMVVIIKPLCFISYYHLVIYNLFKQNYHNENEMVQLLFCSRSFIVFFFWLCPGGCPIACEAWSDRNRGLVADGFKMFQRMSKVFHAAICAVFCHAIFASFWFHTF